MTADYKALSTAIERLTSLTERHADLEADALRARNAAAQALSEVDKAQEEVDDLLFKLKTQAPGMSKWSQSCVASVKVDK